MLKTNEIYRGDCLDLMQNIDGASVDQNYYEMSVKRLNQ